MCVRYLALSLLVYRHADACLRPPPGRLVGAFAPPSPLCLGRRMTVGASLADDAVRANRVESKATALAQSPSGIDAWPLASQAAVFVGTYAALGLATYPATKSLEAISRSVFGLERWRNSVVETALPILLGLVYSAAGIGHFANAEAFQGIYPPIGTWGIWYLPGSSAFHVAWTGAVEILGGTGLLLGGFGGALGLDDEKYDDTLVNFLTPISAAVLFLLTVLVTPANIYSELIVVAVYLWHWFMFVLTCPCH